MVKTVFLASLGSKRGQCFLFLGKKKLSQSFESVIMLVTHENYLEIYLVIIII